MQVLKHGPQVLGLLLRQGHERDDKEHRPALALRDPPKPPQYQHLRDQRFPAGRGGRVHQVAPPQDPAAVGPEALDLPRKHVLDALLGVPVGDADGHPPRRQVVRVTLHETARRIVPAANSTPDRCTHAKHVLQGLRRLAARTHQVPQLRPGAVVRVVLAVAVNARLRHGRRPRHRFPRERHVRPFPRPFVQVPLPQTVVGPVRVDPHTEQVLEVLLLVRRRRPLFLVQVLVPAPAVVRQRWIELRRAR